MTGSPAHHARVMLGILLIVASFYGFWFRGHFQTTDEACVFQAGLSLWDAGNLSIEPGPRHYRVVGRDGRFYTMVNSGQSIAAVPLIACGRVVMAVEEALTARGAVSRLWVPPCPTAIDAWRYAVDVFAGLWLGVLLIGALACVFYAFSVALGVRPPTAAALAVVVATCSYVGGFATNFFQHAAESLFILWSLYFLFRASQEEAPRRWLLAAGVTAGLLVQFRFPAIQAWLSLLLYCAISQAPRRRCGWFVAPLLAALALHYVDQYVRFGSFGLPGDYGRAGFHSALWISLQGFLISPGDSVFLYTPLLLLLPFAAPPFWRGRRHLTIAIAALCATYLVGCGSFEHWSGIWCFGPRYLAALTAPLLLPLGPWLDARPARWRVAALPALLGLGVVVLHVTVNFNTNFRVEGYFASTPEYQFLFEPARSPILTHARALLLRDGRVDFWLYNLGRSEGVGTALLFSALFLCGGLLGLTQVRQGLRPAARPGGASRWRGGLTLGAMSLLGLLMVRTPGLRHPQPWEHVESTAQWQQVQQAVEALDVDHDPARAIVGLREVLEVDPDNQYAWYKLAEAVEKRGTPADARGPWRAVLRLAGSPSASQYATDEARRRLR